MSKRKPPQTEEELLKALIDLLSDDDDSTQEEIDQELRELGYNPDEIAVQMKQAAARGAAQSPYNWRNQADGEIEKERGRQARFAQPKGKTHEELVSAVTALANRLGISRGKLVGAHHRNFSEMSDEDLGTMLRDLEFLEAEQQKPDEE